MRIAVYNLHFATLGGGERRSALLAAHLARTHEVAIFSAGPLEKEKIRHLFDIDVSELENIVLPPSESDHAAAVAAWQPDLLINNSYTSRLRCPAPRGIYMCMFPEGRADGLEGYQAITANSAYTQGWIAQLWQRPAEVVYSAVEPMGPPTPKENIILNVARFQADVGTNHFKQQDLLLEAFYRLLPQVDSPWELHFVGNIGSAFGDRIYAESLQRRARLPGVHLHFGVSQSALRELYRRASFYWHATGCSDPEGNNPARQEHFGMTILEAMSAGAIPLAFRGGGPRETIVHAASGYLWTHPDELLKYTRYLISNPLLRRAMSEQAIQRSRQFDKSQYLQRMDAIVSRLCAS